MRSVGISVVTAAAENAKQGEQEVDDVEVQTHGDVNGVVERGRDLAGAVHVVADVEGEEPSGQIFHEAEVLKRRHEDLDDTDDDQAQEGHEEGAADPFVELREQEPRNAHDCRDGCRDESCLCHHTGLRQLVVSEYRSEDGAEGHHHQVEPDE